MARRPAAVWFEYVFVRQDGSARGRRRTREQVVNDVCDAWAFWLMDWLMVWVRIIEAIGTVQGLGRQWKSIGSVRS